MNESLSVSKPLRAVLYAVILFFVLLTSYPVFWVIASSFKTATDTTMNAPYSMPTSLYIGNYVTALTQSKLVLYFVNSTAVAVFTLAGIVVLGAPAAYAISKIRFRQANALMSFFLLGIMIPLFVCLIPMFQIYNALGLRNTYLSLILPQVGFALPMCIFLYVNFMKFVPDSLIEAAMIDGAGNFQAFLRIIFPMATNSTITIIIFNFVNIWNEFTFANTFMTKNTMKTLPVGLNDFVGEMGRRDWGATFAAITLAILPTLIIYFFLNKHVMEGMAAGAIKD
jgi:raffinose/stachyose/melibiose transport system permease protein